MSDIFDKFIDKVIVISSENCPHCTALKKKLESDGKTEGVVVLDVEKSDEAKLIAQAFNIMSVPSVVNVIKSDNKTVLCLLDKDMNIKDCLEVGSGEGEDAKG